MTESHYTIMIKKAKRLISSRSGVIKGIYPAFTQHFDPETFSFGTEKTDTSRFFLHQAPERGGAAGCKKENAYIASIGEAIERYCCAIYNPEELIFDSYKNLSKRTNVVHPDKFALFSERQYKLKGFPYKKFTEESRISWVKVFSLVNKEEVFVPAQTIFLPFSRRKEEIPICPITSTGLAAGPSRDFALLNALYEIIERDAFTIIWLSKLTPPRLNIQNFRLLDKFFKSKFCVNNFKYTFYDITLDIKIPTAMVILEGQIEIGKIIGVGCGTRITMEESLKKALLEVSQLPPWIRYSYQKEPKWNCRRDFSNIRSFDDHGQLYTRRNDLVKKAFSFLKKNKSGKKIFRRNKQYEKPGEILEFCIKEIRKHGFDIFYRDLTTCDIRDAGFCVVRVIVPGLIPLHGDHRYPFLGGQRIYDVPVKLGFMSSCCESDINLYPHPSA